MFRRKKKRHYKKAEYPILQGNIVEDSVTETCSTGKFKTTFNIITLQTNKEVPCVYWSNFQTIKKGQLVILEGFKKNDCFICKKVTMIDTPYNFG